MKKIISIILLLLCVFVLSACDSGNESSQPVVEAHTHTFGEWVLVKEATCTEGKEEERSCACGEKESKWTEAAGHMEAIDAAIKATCTTDGKTEGKHCSVCNEVLVAQNVVAKLGHTEVIDKAVKATCTKKGKTEGKHCSVCNEVIVARKVVAKLGHTEVVDKAVKATCAKEGKTKGKHCSVCNKVLVAQTTIEKLEHDEVIIPRVEPTCTTTGKSKGRYCSVCKEILKEQKDLPTSEHEFGEWSVVKYATETKKGERKHTCTVCNTTETGVINPMKNTDSKHGSAAYFGETTVIVSIFANDKNTSWDFDSEEDKKTLDTMYDHLCSAGYWLESQGETYGVNTKFIYDWRENPDLYYTADFSSDDMITPSGKFLPTQRAFISENVDSNELMQKYNAQNILYIVYFDVPVTNTVSSWCSYKSPYSNSNSMEVINIFNKFCYGEGQYYLSPAATFAHEILHAFGAPDLYYKNSRVPQEYVDYCNQIKSSDIMFTVNVGKSISVRFTELCAYYLGLKDSAADVEEWNLGKSYYDAE